MLQQVSYACLVIKRSTLLLILGVTACVPTRSHRSVDAGSLKDFTASSKIVESQTFSVTAEGSCGQEIDPVMAASPEIDLATSTLMPVLINPQFPNYPSGAIVKNQSGVVIVEIRVNEVGAVTHAQIVDGSEPFASAVLESVRRWRFRPLLAQDSHCRWRGRAAVEFNVEPDNLHSVVVSPPGRLAIHGRDASELKIKHAALSQQMPNYPPDAASNGMAGKVVLDVDVGEDGSVANIAIVQGIAPFDAASTRAVKNWRYVPVVLNGIRTRWKTRITFDFQIPAADAPSKREISIPASLPKTTDKYSDPP